MKSGLCVWGKWKICLTKKANYDICKKEKQPTIVDCFLRGAWRIRTAVDGFADRWLSHSSKAPWLSFLICGCKGTILIRIYQNFYLLFLFKTMLFACFYAFTIAFRCFLFLVSIITSVFYWTVVATTASMF